MIYMQASQVSLLGHQATPDAHGEWMEAIYTSSLSNDTTNCSW
jgi:hypothetical protein